MGLVEHSSVAFAKRVLPPIVGTHGRLLERQETADNSEEWNIQNFIQRALPAHCSRAPTEATAVRDFQLKLDSYLF
jgi:hypothetical protein